MRAGRLEEIFWGDEILVVTESSEFNKRYDSEWALRDFARSFPNTEIVKISPTGKKKLRVGVWDATAKALHEKRYGDAIKYSEELEKHVFDSDTDYINKIHQSRKTNITVLK